MLGENKTCVLYGTALSFQVHFVKYPPAILTPLGLLVILVCLLARCVRTQTWPQHGSVLEQGCLQT